ncbi:MAG: ACT domain-containing protein [Oscillospiraceae bacterium]
MIKTITNIDFFDDVALVSINNIPNHVKNIAGILNIIGNNGISIDMISQSAPHKDKSNISFTLSQDDLGEVVVATQEFKKLSPMISTDVNGNNTKILLKGEGMRSEFGVAAELFTILSDNDIQVKLITTAETEISCLIDIKDVDKAKEILKK